MFSKKDQRFYLPSPCGELLYSWYLHLEPQLHQLLFLDCLPNLSWEVGDLCDSCTQVDRSMIGGHLEMSHLVESASIGQRFFVQWFTNHLNRTCGFLVFREEEEKTAQGTVMTYTEDIGDMCIFLSKGVAFCIPASSCSGLKPNFIYFASHGIGIYSLAHGTFHRFHVPTTFQEGDWVYSTL